ncbi:tyrosine-type recombinase/integrase [Vibrio marisflavi]|uniref:Tyrosine recombinase XerC n=1 Tax=Vibrio marisflavi CECT 7928 TaxID=634439 RepID=A0ABN8E9R4_9VIBR|nr:tyrosine-type recombinase/integrase [Vibrio marisflavi]CAH0542977.1 Tyrosine recombinase XerC [Vibrio marisflavi CECT 7928]
MPSFPVRDVEELREIIKRMDEINPLIAMMIEFETRTGLRFVDVSKLKFSDLMINGVVRRSFVVVQSKPYHARLRHMSEKQAREKSKVTIHVNDQLEELIKRIYVANGKHKLLFQSDHHLAKPDTALSIQYVNRAYKRIARDLQLPYSLSTHSMRKTFAMFLLDQQASMKTIMEALGQSSLSATQHYLNTFMDETKEYTTNIDF